MLSAPPAHMPNLILSGSRAPSASAVWSKIGSEVSLLKEYQLLNWIRDRLHYNLGIRASATVLAPIFALIAAIALLQTRSANDHAIAQSRADLDRYTEMARSVSLDPVSDAILSSVVPLLDQAAGLPSAVNAPTQWFPGLSQTDKLSSGAREVYHHALEHVLLPRLIVRLEGQMRSRFQDPAFLYEATRIYLMLGSAGPLDRDLIKEWMGLDWQLQFPGPAAKPLRDSLQRHLGALLDQPLENLPLDGALVEDARRAFSRVTLAQRVYGAIKAWQPARAPPGGRRTPLAPRAHACSSAVPVRR